MALLSQLEQTLVLWYLSSWRMMFLKQLGLVMLLFLALQVMGKLNLMEQMLVFWFLERSSVLLNLQKGMLELLLKELSNLVV